MSEYKNLPEEFIIEGSPLKCQFCGNKQFYKYETALGSAWLNFFNLAIFAESTISYICSNCGFKHEFFAKIPKPTKRLFGDY